jgi:predicted DNA-binding antitoxin AbrB/MazE fold protein
MGISFDAVYENGVFRPLEPVHLVDGVRLHLTLSPPVGRLTEEQVQAMLRQGQKVFEGFTDEEMAEIEAHIRGQRGAENLPPEER